MCIVLALKFKTLFWLSNNSFAADNTIYKISKFFKVLSLCASQYLIILLKLQTINLFTSFSSTLNTFEIL